MSIHSTKSATSNQFSNRRAAIAMKPTQPMSDLTIQQQPAGSSETKRKNEELRSHLGITIKWSLDSASRRRIGLPPAAAGALAPVEFGGAAWL
ncbi:hypothetical protein [Kribbella sp. NPDC049584]|uniref:hypothetical protein n=1 Tax=Kribbella sp. NPDC049584 TaxID=3154833 RepID=UPI00342AF6D9